MRGKGCRVSTGPGADTQVRPYMRAGCVGADLYVGPACERIAQFDRQHALGCCARGEKSAKLTAARALPRPRCVAWVIAAGGLVLGRQARENVGDGQA
jgi:hypothetical protein